MSTYPEPIFYPERGSGAFLYDKSGKEYLDFGSGIGVTSLGHAHPALVQTVVDQGSKLWHVSNLYGIEAREQLADKLVSNSFAEKVFYCNSGLESFEGAIKLARRYYYARGDKEKYEIIGFGGGFHGRSLGGLFTQELSKREAFGPPLGGFNTVEFGNLPAVEKAISDKTAAIIIEPIQGEGGIRVATPDFMKSLRKLADERGCLLIVDEIQCGMGRTGALWAHEHSHIVPDIMMVSKALGGGFPVGAVLSSAKVAEGFTVGSHGTTFGGNPLAMAVARVVFDAISTPDMLIHVRDTGRYLEERLDAVIAGRQDIYEGRRGIGLMQGLVCRGKPLEVTGKLASLGLLVIPTAGNVIRLLPPFVIGTEEIDVAADILSRV